MVAKLISEGEFKVGRNEADATTRSKAVNAIQPAE
jgi:hypothetical protein